MIRIFDDNKNICECCEDDSSILIVLKEDVKHKGLSREFYLCKEHKKKLLDELLLF